MIKSIKVTNAAGEELTITLRSPAESGLFIRSIDGLGAPGARINTTQVLNVAGELYNSGLIGKRHIVIDMGFYYWHSDDIETLRQKSYKYFPSNGEITLEVETDLRTYVTTAYVEKNQPKIFTRNAGTMISLICPDAFLRDEVETLTEFDTLDGGFTFPFDEAQLYFAEIGTIEAKNINYAGSTPTGIAVTVFLRGDVTELKIYNVTHAVLIGLDDSVVTAIAGSGLQANDRIEITTDVGNKTITLYKADGSVHNILSAMTSDSTWLQLYPGDNVFYYSAATGGNDIAFDIRHTALHEGV